MAIDTSIPRTRRALLAGGVGGLAAVMASALSRPLPVGAASGNFDSAAATSAALMGTHTATSGGPALGAYGRSASTGGTGVFGYAYAASGFTYGARGESISTSGMGVYGYARASTGSTRGVYGRVLSPDGSGVIGYSGTGFDPAPVAKTGVYGWAAQGAESRGVYGRASEGRGVYGRADSGEGVRGYATSGVGLSGEAATGYALQTSGRLKVDKASGVATIAATKSSIVVPTDLDVSSSSFVLLTPRGNLGGRDLWYTVNATTNEITIRVSTAVTANLKVGWLLLG